MNFGTVKDIFAQRLVESYVSEDTKGKTLYKKFLSLLSENEILRTQFIVYKNIETRTLSSEISANEYLKENLSLLSKYKKSDIILENQRLEKALNKIGLDSSYLEDGHKEIYECLNTLITKEKNASSINEIHDSYEKVKNWLLTEKVEEEDRSIIRKDIDVNKFLES
nr:hypothetical protein [Candidatus Dadabacteria bacterium]